MRHDRTDQTEDRVELRESGVDQGVGEHVVALGHADDTVGADLALADGGEQAGGAHGDADAEAEGPADGAGLAVGAGSSTRYGLTSYKSVIA